LGCNECKNNAQESSRKSSGSNSEALDYLSATSNIAMMCCMENTEPHGLEGELLMSRQVTRAEWVKIDRVDELVERQQLVLRGEIENIGWRC
jgi:hypothetical protein